MEITTDEIYDMRKRGDSVYELLKLPILQSEEVIIELLVPGEPPHEICRFESLGDLDTWQQKYHEAENGISAIIASFAAYKERRECERPHK